MLAEQQRWTMIAAITCHEPLQLHRAIPTSHRPPGILRITGPFSKSLQNNVVRTLPQTTAGTRSSQTAASTRSPTPSPAPNLPRPLPVTRSPQTTVGTRSPLAPYRRHIAGGLLYCKDWGRGACLAGRGGGLLPTVQQRHDGPERRVKPR